MSDKTKYFFVDVRAETTGEVVNIVSRGYKKAVKSFQNQYPKLKEVMVEWLKNDKLQHKLQKLPLGRKKKIGN